MGALDAGFWVIVAVAVIPCILLFIVGRMLSKTPQAKMMTEAEKRIKEGIPFHVTIEYQVGKVMQHLLNIRAQYEQTRSYEYRAKVGDAPFRRPYSFVLQDYSFRVTDIKKNTFELYDIRQYDIGMKEKFSRTHISRFYITARKGYENTRYYELDLLPELMALVCFIYLLKTDGVARIDALSLADYAQIRRATRTDNDREYTWSEMHT